MYNYYGNLVPIMRGLVHVEILIDMMGFEGRTAETELPSTDGRTEHSPVRSTWLLHSAASELDPRLTLNSLESRK